MPTASESDASALSSAGGGADDKAPPVASLPKTRDAAVPPPTPAPATLAFSEPVAVAVVYVYAPVLPIDVLRVVFAPLACDVKTLSAAACVSVAWRDAALEHSLWGLTRLRFAPKAARKLTNQALRCACAAHGKLFAARQPRWLHAAERAWRSDGAAWHEARHSGPARREVPQQLERSHGEAAEARAPSDLSGREQEPNLRVYGASARAALPAAVWAAGHAV